MWSRMDRKERGMDFNELTEEQKATSQDVAEADAQDSSAGANPTAGSASGDDETQAEDDSQDAALPTDETQAGDDEQTTDDEQG